MTGCVLRGVFLASQPIDASAVSGVSINILGAGVTLQLGTISSAVALAMAFLAAKARRMPQPLPGARLLQWAPATSWK